MNIQNFNAMIQLIYSHESFDAIEDIRAAIREMAGGDVTVSDKGRSINRMANWLDITRVEAEKLYDIGDYIDLMMENDVCGESLAVSVVGILEIFRDTGHLSWGFTNNNGNEREIVRNQHG